MIVIWPAAFHAPEPIYPEGLAFVPPFLERHGAFVGDEDLASTVRIRDLKRKFGGLHVSLGDSGLHIADVTEPEAPAAARDVDVAPLVTAEGRWTATWAIRWDPARAASASGLVMLSHSPSLEAPGTRRPSPSSPSSFCTAES
jgi:hypothetical protein